MPNMNHMPENLQAKQVYNNFEQMVLAKNFFLPFMSSDDTAIFKEIPYRGDGFTMNIATSMPLSPAGFIGPDQQILGTEERINLASNVVVLKELAKSVSLPNSDYYKQANSLNLLAEYTGQLSTAMSNKLALTFTGAMTTDLYSLSATARTAPSRDRVVYAGVAENEYNTENIHNNLTHIPADAEGVFSLNHLLALISKAQKGLAADGMSLNLSPTTSFGGVSSKERFGLVLMLTSNSWNQLRNDPEFKQYIHGFRTDQRVPDGITGSLWKGQVEGVDIYHCPHLDSIDVKGANGEYNWDLLLGREAIVYSMPEGENATSYKIAKKGIDYADRILGLCALAKIGIKTMILPFKGEQLEMGIIHSFVKKK